MYDFVLHRYLKPIAISAGVLLLVMEARFLDGLQYPIFGHSIPLRNSLLFIVCNAGWMLSIALPLSAVIGTVVTYSRLPYLRILLSRSDLVFPPRRFLATAIPPAILLCIVFFLHNAAFLPEMNRQARMRSVGYLRFYAYPDSLQDIHILDESIAIERGPRELSLKALRETLTDTGNNLGTSDADSRARKRTEIVCEIQKRYALSVAPLIAVFAMAPLGFILRKRKIYASIGIGLTVSALYTVVLVYTGNLDVIHRLSPYLVWSGNALLFVIALVSLPAANCNYHALQKVIESRIHAVSSTVRMRDNSGKF
jgi:lipopolysaccharide export LptBFGC system permease protein LptF